MSNMTNSRITWDQYFMGLAFAVAQRSEDTTKHGTVLVSKLNNIILGTGYNGIMSGVDSSKFDLTRPAKYIHYIHSEENAILNASQPLRFVPGGVKAYVSGKCCINCLQRLVQVDIKDIFCLKIEKSFSYEDKELVLFDKIIKEANVNLIFIDKKDIGWLSASYL